MNNEYTNIRFPNESYYDEVPDFKLEDFRLIQEFDDSIYGVWQDTHVFIEREDYEKHMINEKSTTK